MNVNDTKKRVAVLVPCFNRKELVLRCINTIRKQTYDDLLIICVDDGSTDGTGEMLDAIAAEDQRLVVVHKTNGGIASARNVCLRTLFGIGGCDYIAWVDSDDWLDPTFVSVLVEVLEKNCSDIVRCCFVPVTDAKQASSQQNSFSADSHNYSAEDEIRALCRDEFLPLWGVLFKCDLFADIQFDEKYIMCEDYVVLPHVIERATRITRIDYAGYYYQTGHNHTSVTKQSYSNPMLLSICQAEIEFYSFLRLSGRDGLAEKRVPIVANSFLGLFGRFSRRMASDEDREWFASIRRYERQGEFIKRARFNNKQRRVLQFLYLYCRPLFHLLYCTLGRHIARDRR